MLIIRAKLGDIGCSSFALINTHTAARAIIFCLLKF